MIVGSWYLQLAAIWHWYLPLCILYKTFLYIVSLHSVYILKKYRIDESDGLIVNNSVCWLNMLL